MHALLIVLAAWISPAGAQSNSCVSLNTSIKGLKAGADQKILEIIYAGEPLRVLSKSRDDRHLKVSLGGEAYWVRSKEFTRLDPSNCAKSNICVYLGPNTQIHSRPRKNDTALVVETGLFPVVSSYGSWYRVKTSSGFVWMTGSEMRSRRQGCEEPVTRETILESYEAPRSRKGWLFGLEGGYLPSVSSEPLNNILTPRPGAGVDVNDDAFDNPFIQEVMDGAGWYVGATVEFPLLWNLRNKLAVGYKTRSLEYVVRPNPFSATNPVITYDQLASETQSYDFTFMYVTTVLKYEGWHVLGLEIQPGILLGIDYSLDEFGITFLTSPQKTVPRVVPSGYNEFEFLYGPRLDINFKFLTFNAGALFTNYGLEPTFGVGVQF